MNLTRALPAAIREHRLANGLEVLIAERRGDPVVAVMVWYKVGSKNERDFESGVSHFLEHMMFKGSSRFGKGSIDRITTELGGANNAFTSYDHTAYWFELASDRWERALEIEADRMRTLTLDAAEYDAERAVVLEELSMGQDDPWRVLAERVQAATIPRHPYRRPIIGFPDALSSLAVEAMRDYYRRFYRPGNAVVIVCGDVDADEALAAVAKHFEGLPAGDEQPSPESFRPTETEPRGEQRLSMNWDDQGKRLCMAFPTAKFASDDDATLDVISSLLTGGRLSRLHRRLVLEQALATSISTSNDTRVEGGLFWLFAECAQDVPPARLEAAIDAELSLLREELVSAKELTRVKHMLEAAEAYDHETVTDIAEDLGEHATDSHWKLAFEAIERVKAVDAKRVRACARRFLRADRRVLGWCLPTKAEPAQKRAKPQKKAKHRR
ncbi:MAG: insulinase family protein [Planctomycetes bacterium]|nr:insulinase family protein [Planctomycetota bacterium]